MSVGIASTVLVDIIREYMQLAQNNVYVRNINYVPPRVADELYVAVGLLSSNVYASNNSYNGNGVGLEEKVSVSVLEDLQIDIYGKFDSNFNASLFVRRYEVIASLQSTYSLQKQQENQVFIQKLPSSFIDTSESQGAEIINKASITVSCFASKAITRSLDETNGNYYNEFSINSQDDNDKTDDIVIEIPEV